VDTSVLLPDTTKQQFWFSGQSMRWWLDIKLLFISDMSHDHQPASLGMAKKFVRLERARVRFCFDFHMLS
jgi:hypothetical protein